MTNPIRAGWLSPAMPALLKLAAFAVAGAAAGYAFHRFVGCRTGSCAIWASPVLSTGYGALLGLLLGRV
ncbi:MAG: hypothetical protein IT376_21180 [Polyangiaceae bacterium]|nr:hypothetical protein [Polyangiaceae bacterium]